jgi:hypothetical protein
VGQQVLIPIANGSEEMEIIILVDVLRRAKINVVLASVEKSPNIVGSQRMTIVADKSIMGASDSNYDLIILPVSFLAVHLFIRKIINGTTHFNKISSIQLIHRCGTKLSPPPHLILLIISWYSQVGSSLTYGQL